MSDSSYPLAALDRHVSAIVDSELPSDVFKILLDACRSAVPRAAVFLVRKGQVKGWGCVGYAAGPAQQLRSWVGAEGEGFLGELGQATAGPVRRGDGHDVDPDFGQGPAAETVGYAIRVKGKPIALLVAERDAQEPPWSPEAVNVLVRVAELRLDVDLLRRKLRAAESSTDEPKAAAAESRPAAKAEADPELDAARRFARLVATDIRLYNEEAVMLGRRHGDLVSRLDEHLARGRDTFLKRHGNLGPRARQVLLEAYVDVLAGGDAGLMPESALD